MSSSPPAIMFFEKFLLSCVFIGWKSGYRIGRLRFGFLFSFYGCKVRIDEAIFHPCSYCLEYNLVGVYVACSSEPLGQFFF